MSLVLAKEKVSAAHDRGMRANSRNRDQDLTVYQNSYVLNKVKALKMEQSQCTATHLSYEMKANRIFVMRLSPAACELAKLVVVEEIHSDPFYLNFYIESCINEDECQNQVGSVYRIFNRTREGKGKYLKFTINFHHTTSTIFVNGNRVEIFETELFEKICKGIRAMEANLTLVNEQISMALSDIERKKGPFKQKAITNGTESQYDLSNVREDSEANNK